jgi:uracil-DNA glycosylase
MSDIGIFPFGQPIKKVEQKDWTPKRVFVLGVYASAVHARWIGPDGEPRIKAVGVASEPEIFWTGDGAEEIVSAIEIPEGAGKLVAAPKNLNGPSGRALDEHFLEPLGLSREDAWLCDLVPYSCMNPSQGLALKRSYLPAAKGHNLPGFKWGPVPTVLASENRRKQIAGELALARPDVLITLGDLPLKWFARHFGSRAALSTYGEDDSSYGRLHPIELDGRKVGLLPLVHPRQAGRLGRHSAHWAGLHGKWTRNVASGLLK